MVRPKTLEEWEETIGTLAQGIVNLEQVVKAQGALLQGVDARVRLQQALIDNHQAVLIAAGLASPRPKEDLLEIIH